GAARFAPIQREFSSTAPHDQEPPGFYRLQDPLLLCHLSPKDFPIPVVAVLESRSLRFRLPPTIPFGRALCRASAIKIFRKCSENLRKISEMPMSNRHKHQYQFGRFAVDRSKGLLLCDGEIVPLQPKAFDTLLLLIERRGEVLTKDELLRQLWPDSFVEESNLSQNIYVLRKALAQTPGGDELIKTVPKRGYRFVGDVREVSDNAELTIEEHLWTRVVTDEESYDDAMVLPAEVAKRTIELDHVTSPGNWSTVLSRRVVLVTVGLGIVAAFGAYGAWRMNLRSRLHGSKMDESRARDFQSMKIQRLTDIGKVLHPAISPDGKYLVYVLRDSTDKTSLWIKHIASGSAKQIVEAGHGLGDYEAPTFSPDSSFVYFIGLANGVYKLYRVPVLGGNPRKLIDDVWGRVALSPDGRYLAF